MQTMVTVTLCDEDSGCWLSYDRTAIANAGSLVIAGTVRVPHNPLPTDYSTVQVPRTPDPVYEYSCTEAVLTRCTPPKPQIKPIPW
jgi:hypothetical protein